MQFNVSWFYVYHNREHARMIILHNRTSTYIIHTTTLHTFWDSSKESVEREIIEIFLEFKKENVFEYYFPFIAFN